SGVDGDVLALAVSGADLYAGGAFRTAGGSPVNGIAKWDGSRWSALGLGMNSFVSAVAVSGSNVYAAGDFTSATNADGVGIPAYHVAKWDGTSWSALRAGI